MLFNHRRSTKAVDPTDLTAIPGNCFAIFSPWTKQRAAELSRSKTISRG